MKQSISQEQLLEITKKQSDRLLGWMTNRGYYDTSEVKLNIGQMIEFLYEKVGQKTFNTNIGEIGIEPTGIDIYLPNKPADSPTGYNRGGRLLIAWNRGYIWKDKDIIGYEDSGELCDALWEAVKEILKK